MGERSTATCSPRLVKWNTFEFSGTWQPESWYWSWLLEVFTLDSFIEIFSFFLKLDASDRWYLLSFFLHLSKLFIFILWSPVRFSRCLTHHKEFWVTQYHQIHQKLFFASMQSNTGQSHQLMFTQVSDDYIEVKAIDYKIDYWLNFLLKGLIYCMQQCMRYVFINNIKRTAKMLILIHFILFSLGMHWVWIIRTSRMQSCFRLTEVNLRNYMKMIAREYRVYMDLAAKIKTKRRECWERWKEYETEYSGKCSRFQKMFLHQYVKYSIVFANNW